MRTAGRARRWFSTTTWGAAGWQQGLAAAIAAVIFWPQASIDPVVGPDPSWQAGLALARIHNLAWGPEIVFTYGPLGFLQNIAYYSFGQSLLATIYQPVVVAALFLGIAAALRQRHAPMTSLIGAFATTGIIALLHIGHGSGVPGLAYPELAILAAFVWAAVPLLQPDPGRSTVLITCIALGSAAGLQLLVKFNTGLAIVGIALAVSVLLDWRALGRHGATVSAFAASTLIWWVLAGQQPANLPSWLKSAAAMMSGYGEGMALPLRSLRLYGETAVVLSLAWIVALCVVFVLGRPEIPRRYVVLVGFVSMIVAKTAFVLFDLWRSLAALGFIVVVVAITPLTGIPKIPRRALVVIVATLLVGQLGLDTAGTFVSWISRLASWRRCRRPGKRSTAWSRWPCQATSTNASDKPRHASVRSTPSRTAIIKTIGSGTVHVDPYETSAVWAYDFAWRPAPVFQTYAAYTPTLDDLNGETLANGPEFVLSRLSPNSPATGNIGARLGVQESPRYSRALLCNYTLNGVEGRWALFTHTGPRCGPLTALSQVPVRGNDVITIPAPSRPGDGGPGRDRSGANHHRPTLPGRRRSADHADRRTRREHLPPHHRQRRRAVSRQFPCFGGGHEPADPGPHHRSRPYSIAGSGRLLRDCVSMRCASNRNRRIYNPHA